MIMENISHASSKREKNNQYPPDLEYSCDYAPVREDSLIIYSQECRFLPKRFYTIFLKLYVLPCLLGNYYYTPFLPAKIKISKEEFLIPVWVWGMILSEGLVQGLRACVSSSCSSEERSMFRRNQGMEQEEQEREGILRVQEENQPCHPHLVSRNMMQRAWKVLWSRILHLSSKGSRELRCQDSMTVQWELSVKSDWEKFGKSSRPLIGAHCQHVRAYVIRQRVCFFLTVAGVTESKLLFCDFLFLILMSE